MNILRCKLNLFHRQQSGISLIEVLLGILVTALLAFGATMATVQILQQARANLVVGENVRGVARIVRTYLHETAPGVRETGATVPVIYSYVIIATGTSTANGDLVIGSQSVVASTPGGGQANIYAKNTIDLKAYANVDGSGQVSGAGPITLRSNAVLTGDKIYDLPLTPERVDTNEVKTAAQAGGTVDAQSLSSGTFNGPKYVNGDLSISGDAKVILAGGPVYVKGNLYINNAARIEGPGTIVAEGEIDVKGASDWNPTVSQIPLIVTTSNKNNAISLNSNSRIAGTLYAMNGDVKITGNSSVYGNIIGVNVKAQSGNEKSTITYPTALGER